MTPYALGKNITNGIIAGMKYYLKPVDLPINKFNIE